MPMSSTEQNSPEVIVIAGGGQAGGEAAIQLRQNGFEGRVVLVGDEPYLPYSRPPLSKAFLSGELDAESLLLRASSTYEEAGIEALTSSSVTTIDRAGHCVTLSGGMVLGYSKLILATGGRARPMRVAGADLANIFYLRSISDVEQLQAAFLPGKRLVIVGGGYIGLEVAAVAIKLGLDVTVLEGAARVLARVTSPEMSAFYTRVHTEHGVKIRTDVVVSGFEAGADGVSVGHVAFGAGETVDADLVLIGIGLIPNCELAEAAGLAVENGITVDGHGRTSDPDIFAIGDCASHASHGFLARKVRLESVPNAIEQARIAAAEICGKPVPAVTAPWFWSDQYKLKLQMVGLSDGYDRLVIRGDMAAASFITFYLKDQRIIAADAVNRPAEFMVAKRLVGEQKMVAAEALADETQPLKLLLAAASAHT